MKCLADRWVLFRGWAAERDIVSDRFIVATASTTSLTPIWKARMDDRKSQPLFLVIVLALLGISTLPRALTSDSSSSKAVTPKVTGETATTRDSSPPSSVPRTFDNPD